MKLSQDIIFYQIRKRYTPSFLFRTEALDVGRPVFHDHANIPPQTCVIIEKEALAGLSVCLSKGGSAGPPPAGSLFICPEEPDLPVHLPGCSIICVAGEHSVFGLFNLLQKIFNRFDRWDNCLGEACIRGGRFQELIDCSEEVIATPVSLMDAAFHYVAFCRRSSEIGLVDKYMDANGNLPFDMVNELLIGADYSKHCRKTDVFFCTQDDHYMVCKNVFHRGLFAGRLYVVYDRPEEPKDRYYTAVLTHLAEYVARLYQTHGSFNSNQTGRNSLRRILLDTLEKTDGSTGNWKKAIRENGWSSRERYLLIQFRPNPRYDKNPHADYLAREIERKWQGCLCFEFQNRLMLLVNQDRFRTGDNLAFQQAMAYFLRESLLVAGISRTVRTLKDICPAYEQTEAAIEYGVKASPTLWSFHFEDYALDYLVRQSRGRFEPEQICSSKLLALKRHDAQKKTDYYKTLETYFSCKFNASAAAKALFIHRSSFLNRMERIQKRVRIDFNSTDELLYIALCFKILKGR